MSSDNDFIEEVPNYDVEPESNNHVLWMLLALCLLAYSGWFAVHAFDRGTIPPTIVYRILPPVKSEVRPSTASAYVCSTAGAGTGLTTNVCTQSVCSWQVRSAATTTTTAEWR